MLVPASVPLSPPPPRPAKFKETQAQTNETRTENRTRETHFCGRERPHFGLRFTAKIPPGFGSRSRPQCHRPNSGGSAGVSRVCTRHTTAKNKGLFRRSHHNLIEGRQTMPLLKPPEPRLATRRFYLRIDESLAETAVRYAEFLGTDKLDHVVSQALAFIFKRDAQFKHWL